jgi:hypothetical protein
VLWVLTSVRRAQPFMVDAAVEDLASLDRDVGRAFGALEAFRESLIADASGAAADPFEGLRHVAGKSTWEALGELSPSAADVPLRDALRRWVAAFVQARIGLDTERAWAESASALQGHFAGDVPRRVSWRDAWRGVAFSRSAAEARLWLEAAAPAAPALAAVATTRAIRRLEVARRMGGNHPWDELVPVPRAALRDAASLFLRSTEDLSTASRHETKESEDPGAAFFSAAAREATAGWPARLTASWLREVFRDQPHVGSLRLDALPRPVGAASFGRALHQFGFAARVALTPERTLFALAREPAFIGAHRFAFLFGALVSDPEFHVRALGLGKSAARAQARVLTRTVLFEARTRAARLLLGDEAAFAPADLYSELTVRLFGSPLDERFRGAWPPPREDEPARFVGMLQAGGLRRDLRDRFDIDWFHNPRAWDSLREQCAGGAREVVEEAALPTAAEAWARELEEALG